MGYLPDHQLQCGLPATLSFAADGVDLDRGNVQDPSCAHTTGGVSRVIVGRNVTVGHGCVLHGREGDEALIGSVLLDDSVVGEGSVIGEGSL